MVKYEVLLHKRFAKNNEYYFVVRDNESGELIKVYANSKLLFKGTRNNQDQEHIKTININGNCDKNELYKEILKLEPRFLFYISREEQTEEIKRMVLSLDGYALQFISKKDRTRELCKIALNQNGIAYRYVPHEERDNELATMAVSSNGLSIYQISGSLQNMKLCKLAIAQNPRAILKIRDDFMKPLYKELKDNDFEFWKYFSDNEISYLEKKYKTR